MDATWTVPKNIRQIGEAHAHYAVYIEDYVSTYIKQAVRLSDGGIRQGALVGKVYPEEEKTVFVIQGIVTDKEFYRTREQLFSPAGREALRNQCGQYFAELDIIGEVVFDSGKDDMDTVRRGMISENAGARKMFLHVDCADGAKKFYIGSQGAVEIVESYYIYYERNEAMQNYLIAYNEETRRKVEEVHDIISGQARAAMGEFRLPHARLQKDTLLVCVTCALLICVSLLGIVNINQYQKMCEMQESFNHVLVSLGLGDGASVPASSDAALGGAEGNIVADITPEEGLAAGDGQDGLFGGLPIYVSDATGESNVANMTGQNADGSDMANASGESAANEPGQNAGGSDMSNASGESEANEPGQNAGGSDMSNASGESEANEPAQNAGGSDMSNASGESEANEPGQNAGGSDMANASGESAANEPGQNTGGDGMLSERTNGAGVFPDGADTGQDENGDSALTMGEAGENGAYREYTIKKGDTLTSISILFYQNRSMIGQICELNGIENADNIVAGQKILLP